VPPWAAFLKRESDEDLEDEAFCMTTNLPTASPALAGAGTNSLHDIKPPVYIANPWFWVWLGLGTLVLVGVLVLVFRIWKRKREEAGIIPIIPAHVRARQRLQEALALIGQPREFCILVSDTVRWYLEERFEFRAPERTTEEFLHELQSTDMLTPDQKTSLGEFLNRCDLVKFAKYEPRQPELRDLHDSALRLVEETQPTLTLENPTATEAT
jgi:hypothetical protein